MNNSCFFYGIIGLIFNLILGLTKIIIGLISKSITILIDAFNNITDSISSIILLIEYKYKKNNSILKPIKYKKYEYTSSLIISIIMILSSVIFIYNSIKKIIINESLLINRYTYIILIITLLLKIIQYIIYKTNYKNYSISLETILLETKSDILRNLSIIISIVIINVFKINIDGLIGLILSIYIFIISIKLFINSSINILDKNLSKKNENIIINKLEKSKFIIKYENIIIDEYNNIIVDILFIDNNIKKYFNKLKKYYKKELNMNIYINII